MFINTTTIEELTSRLLSLTGTISIHILPHHRALTNSGATVKSLNEDLARSLETGALCGGIKTIAEYYEIDQYEFLYGPNDPLRKLEETYHNEPFVHTGTVADVRVRNNVSREIKLMSMDEVLAMNGDGSGELAEELQSALDQLQHCDDKQELNIQPMDNTIKTNYGPRIYKQNPQPLEKTGTTKLMDKQHTMCNSSNLSELSLDQCLQQLIEKGDKLDKPLTAALAIKYKTSQIAITRKYKELSNQMATSKSVYDEPTNDKSTNMITGNFCKILQPYYSGVPITNTADITDTTPPKSISPEQPSDNDAPSHIEQLQQLGASAILMDIGSELSLEQLILLVSTKLPTGTTLTITGQ